MTTQTHEQPDEIVPAHPQVIGEIADWMYWDAASMGGDSVSGNYVGHDKISRVAQLSILTEHLLGHPDSPCSRDEVRAASQLVVVRWGMLPILAEQFFVDI